MSVTIDTRGMLAPQAKAAAAQAMKGLRMGQRIEVLGATPTLHETLASWCRETGNVLVEAQPHDERYRATLERGSGFPDGNLLQRMAYRLLGIRIHLNLARNLVLHRRPRFLLTFASIPEGLRSRDFSRLGHLPRYTVLPVPNQIDPQCGLVFGFEAKADAVQVFEALRDADFAVENIYVVDDAQSYSPIEET